MAPSIQDVELKNMPWWWRVIGWSMLLIACTSSESVDCTSIGGGLHTTKFKRQYHDILGR